MAHKYICDGCGKQEDTMSSLEPVGHVVPAIYCPDCLTKVQEYMNELDVLHSQLALGFSKKLVALRKKHTKNNFTLPDKI
jgi:late competence protein required for DNA uptake (superfamily II DNA/RNA helicase)